MLCILSPAKKLAVSPAQPCQLTAPKLIADAAVIAAIMREYNPLDLARLMSISDKLAQLNHDRFQNWKANGGKATAAIFTFIGDVYHGLDAPSLSTSDLAAAQKNIRILSGLYGLLRPFDGIYPYRLEMGSKLANPRGANLYSFWKSKVTDLLRQELAENNSKLLINLASNEYSKAIDMDKLTVISPQFLDAKDGKTRMLQLYVKRARGMMARYIVQNQPQTALDLTAFNQQGYVFDKLQSSPSQPVFVRKHAA